MVPHLCTAEGVVEIWLTSEDTGAYGRDIGVTLPELLWKLVEVIPEGARLRLGMTNPPYILEHLQVVPFETCERGIECVEVMDVFPKRACEPVYLFVKFSACKMLLMLSENLYNYEFKPFRRWQK